MNTIYISTATKPNGSDEFFASEEPGEKILSVSFIKSTFFSFRIHERSQIY